MRRVAKVEEDQVCNTMMLTEQTRLVGSNINARRAALAVFWGRVWRVLGQGACCESGLVTHGIGIDKKSKSNSFFCFSLYTDKVGVFMKSLSVCVCVCVCVSSTIRICRTRMWLDTFVRGTVITEKHLKYSH